MDNFEVQFEDVPDLSLGMPDGGQGDPLADLDGLFEELSALEQVSSSIKGELDDSYQKFNLWGADIDLSETEDNAAGFGETGLSLIDDAEGAAGLAVRRNAMVEAGYSTAANADDDALVLMERREIEIDNRSEASAVFEGMLTEVIGTTTGLTAAVSVDKGYEETLDSRTIELINNIQPPPNIGSQDTRALYYKILNVVQDCEDVFTDGIDAITESVLMQAIDLRDDVSAHVLQDIAASKVYIQRCADAILSWKAGSDRQAGFKQRLQQRTAEYLMKPEIENAISLYQAHGEGNTRYVKRIIYNQDGYYVVCPQCGAELPARQHPFVDCTLVAAKGSSQPKLSVLPYNIECQCGVVLTFTASEYREMQRIISRKLSQYLSNCKENILAQSPTTPVLKFRPSFQWLKDAFPYLIESGEGTVMQDGGQALGTIQEPISFNFEEYRQALKIFNTKLQYMGEQPAVWDSEAAKELLVDFDFEEMAVKKDGEGHLGAAEIASFMCNTLSKDYRTLKNQAIACILEEIKGNYVLFRDLDNNSIVLLESVFDLIKRVIDHPVNSFDNQTSMMFTSAYQMVKGREGILKNGQQLLPKDDGYVEAVVGYFKTNTEGLEKYIQVRKARQSSSKKILLGLGSLLCYVKMVRMTTLSLSDVQSVCFDTEIAEFIDALADQVIIKNLVLDFGKAWCSFGNSIFVKLYRDLSLMTAAGRMEAIQKGIGGMFPDIAKTFGNLRTESILHHEPLHRIANAIRKLDYLVFCKEIYQLCVAGCGDYGTLINRVLQTVYEMVQREYNPATNDFLFYCKDFSYDDVKDVDTGACRFGRYILKRLPGESVSDYLVRYEKLYGEQKLDSSNSYDSAEYFEKYAPFLPVLFFAGKLFEIRYTNLVQAFYLSDLIEACQQSDSNQARDILGISDSLSTMLNKQMYHPVLYTKEASRIPKFLLYCYSTDVGEGILQLYTEYAERLLNTSEVVDIGNAFDLDAGIERAIAELEEEEVPFAEAEIQGLREMWS